MKSKKLLIIAGINHSGKTTLGRELSKKLHCNFFDTDLETERLTGKHPAIHVKEGGQVAYNREETRTAKILIDNIKNQDSYTVISTGGGFCDNPEGWHFLKEYGYILWLNSDLETSFGRIAADAKKILDSGGTYEDVPRYPGYKDAKLESMEDFRKMFYEFITPQIQRYRELCDVEINVKDVSVQENLDFLMNKLPA